MDAGGGVDAGLVGWGERFGSKGEDVAGVQNGEDAGVLFRGKLGGMAGHELAGCEDDAGRGGHRGVERGLVLREDERVRRGVADGGDAPDQRAAGELRRMGV